MKNIYNSLLLMLGWDFQGVQQSEGGKERSQKDRKESIKGSKDEGKEGGRKLEREGEKKKVRREKGRKGKRETQVKFSVLPAGSTDNQTEIYY